MKERFIHFKDKNGRLKATAAYVHSDGNTCYAITIVSPSEPVHKVTPQIARDKTRARLYNATCDGMPSLGGIFHWRQYGTNVLGAGTFHSHGPDSAYEIIRQANLAKCGCITEDEFRSKTQTVWQAIAALD